MGRFSNLELGRPEEPGEPPRQDPARDEHYYVRAARERFVDGQFESALRYYARALEFRVEVLEAWLGQAESLLEMGEPREADLWADKGLEIFSENSELLATKAIASARLGAPGRALELSDIAIAGADSSALVWRSRGEILLARSDRNAEFCFARALARSAGDWFETLAIGRVHLRLGRFPSAISYVQKAIDRSGAPSAFAWETLGDGYAGIGRIEKAREAFGRALSIDPRRESARTRLASLDARGSWARAIDRVRSWFGLSRDEG